MKVIKFDKDYFKLDKSFFTTIRIKSKSINFGEIVKIDQPKGSFKALCVGIAKEKFEEIPNPILWPDLENLPLYNVLPWDDYPPEKIQALEIIRRIYPYLNLDSEVYIYSFKRWE